MLLKLARKINKIKIKDHMVIENQIPKTEMVYEIKDEYKVPSYEEFVKSYENGGNLNYEDLSGGGVGEVKGYGPCSDYRCYGSNKCLDGETFYPLYTSCPAEGCEGRWKQTY